LFKIVLSGSNDFCRFFGGDIPRLESLDKSTVGRQRLTSSETVQFWQCQYLDLAKYQMRRPADDVVIAVEANSRFCLIIPPCDGDKALFEQVFIQTLVASVQPFLQQDITNLQFLKTLENFDAEFVGIDWIRNTDLSINGNVADVGQWLKSEYDQAGSLPNLDIEGLQHYLNQLPKKIQRKPNKRVTVFPDKEMIVYWQSKFLEKSNDESKQAVHNNVVSLDDYRKARE